MRLRRRAALAREHAFAWAASALSLTGRLVPAAAGALLLCSCAAAPPEAGAAPSPVVHAMPASAPSAARIPALAELKGLKPAEIVTLLGEPEFRRVEPPAQLWQYRTKDCVLDLFFYPGADGDRVSAAQTRGRVLIGTGMDRCPDEQAFFRPRALETRL